LKSKSQSDTQGEMEEPAGTAAYAPDANLLTVEQACQRLGSISRQTLWRLTKDGELPVVKLGGRRLYEPAAIADFIERNRHGGDAA